MKLSIIIPVYNVEKYICRCIRSCMQQDIDSNEYEIIVVNDGTKDGSMDIVRRISKDACNLRIVEQENCGLSVARNKGLSLANGDYIWFVDSDDYISENCLASIIMHLVDNLDILQIQYQLVYEDGRQNALVSPSIINGIKDGQTVLINGGVDIPAQFSIYRRQFLLDNKLEFFPGIYHEDVEFKPRAILKAKRVSSYNRVVYNYLQREGSITSKKGIKHINDLFLVSDHLFELSTKSEARPVIPYLAMVVACCINWIFIIIDNVSEREKDSTFNRLIEKKYLIEMMTNSSNLKYKIEAYLLLINIKFGRYLYLKLR